jgi:tetratricopeptide (TPR) repeat protein
LIDPVTLLGAARAFRDGGRLADALSCCEFALTHAPGDLELRHLHGCVLIAMDRVEEGVGELNQATEHHSTLPPDYRIDETLAAYRRALALRPEHAEAVIGLATALYRAGRYDEAIAACQHAVTLRPHDAAARGMLGAALGASGRFEPSVAVAREPSRSRPNWPGRTPISAWRSAG